MENCKSCGFRHPQANVCQLTRSAINPDADYCSKFDPNPFLRCDLCGQPFPRLNTNYDITNPDKILTVCPNCRQAYHTCITCASSAICLYETDPSPLPKIVQRQMRNGNMITVTQGRNPDRIAITCKKGCNCFSEEIDDCGRSNTSCCSKYRFIKED